MSILKQSTSRAQQHIPQGISEPCQASRFQLLPPKSASAEACCNHHKHNLSLLAWPLQAVLQASGKLPESSHPVRGWDFNHGRDLDGIMAAMLHSGLQASALGEAVVEVNRMVSYKCCCWHWPCFAVRSQGGPVKGRAFANAYVGC